MIRVRAWTLSLTLAACVGADPAGAERADRDKPVNIEADKLSIDDKKKESVFDGNVTLTQGSLMLRAERVVVKQDAQGLTYAYATGKPVYFRQKREGFDEYVEGYAERMEYDGKKDKVEMFTNAQVKKGVDEVRGDYIAYDAVTEFYQVIGGAPAAGATERPGRVRATIQPKRQPRPSGDQPSTPGAAEQPPKPSGATAASPAVTLKPATRLKNEPER